MAELFDLVTALPNLIAAALRASKRCKHSRARISFLKDIGNNLVIMRKQLLSNTYTFGPYSEKVVMDPKRRIIHKAPFKDRVVHQAIHHILEPIIEKHLIYSNYACRKNKGTTKSLQHAMQKCKKYDYALKLDVKSYFKSINHDVLYKQLCRFIKDKEVLQLLQKLIVSFECGIPIGNLTSQLFANLYLNDLDHYIKRELHVKDYLRYMDDILIFTNSKAEAWDIKQKIVAHCLNNSLIIPERKTSLTPTKYGFIFLGYRIFKNKKPKMLKRKLASLRKKLKHAAMQRNPNGAKERTVFGWYGSAKYGINPKLCKDLGIEEILSRFLKN